MASSTAPKDATHEITLLDVHENSLVGRPANKRPFLIVRSDPDMPTGQELTDDGNGGLTPVHKAFDAGSKRKLKSALSSAVKTLGSLLEGIADADDEASFVKRVNSVSASLGKFGGASEDASGTEKSEPAPATEPSPAPETTEPEVASISAAAVKAVLDAAERRKETEAAETLEKSANERASRQTALSTDLTTLTKAVHALTGIVKSGSGGSRPASQAASTGEGVSDPMAVHKVWNTDMAADEIPADERF